MPILINPASPQATVDTGVGTRGDAAAEGPVEVCGFGDAAARVLASWRCWRRELLDEPELAIWQLAKWNARMAQPNN